MAGIVTKGLVAINCAFDAFLKGLLRLPSNMSADGLRGIINTINEAIDDYRHRMREREAKRQMRAST